MEAASRADSHAAVPWHAANGAGRPEALKAHVAQVFSIPSSSMEPQLLVGDRVLVSRSAHRLHDPNRGDIVVFDAPSAKPADDGFLEGIAEDALESVGLREPGDGELIKRFIGLPGATISARDGHVVVGGRIVEDPYLPAGVTTADFGPVDVPDGHVFVMGDNRGNSADSRVIGPVAVDAIVGRRSPACGPRAGPRSCEARHIAQVASEHVD